MYEFYVTPGHGYLQVPHTEIVELGIYDKISKYSYRKLEKKVWYALLEEDCDASLFADAWEKKNGTKFSYTVVYVEDVPELKYVNHVWPRNLQPYK